MEKFKTVDAEEIISSGQLEQMLNTGTAEVSMLCQKACLKPKKDSFGNIYFSKTDIDVLRKVKELYEHTAQIQAKRQELEPTGETVSEQQNNFLIRAKARLKNELSPEHAAPSLAPSLKDFENNIVERVTAVLSEKMDGLDEVIVELIRSKTENETLRQKLNELNKENFNLKNENTSYKSVGLGLYIKKNTDDFVL